MIIQKTNSHQPNIHLQTCNAVINPSTGVATEYHDIYKDLATKIVWTPSMANELGGLAKDDGTRMKTGTEEKEFIKKSQVPQGKTVPYTRVVTKLGPQKSEPERVRIKVCGNLINYPGGKCTPTTEITTIKMHLNSVVSTPEEKYICIHVHTFYLSMMIEDPNYMMIKVELVPVETNP